VGFIKKESILMSGRKRGKRMGIGGVWGTTTGGRVLKKTIMLKKINEWN